MADFSDSRTRSVLIVAGEASGDLHGSNLVREMRRIDPGLEFKGIGGRRMAGAGVRILANASDMAVVGLTEVASRLKLIVENFFRLKRLLREEKPGLVILIDYPDFNLPLAKAARKEGLRVFYYISPQVWAWRTGRIGRLKRDVDRMAVILPFEEPFYRRAGMQVDFVGHPLLDAVKRKYSREETLDRIGLDAELPVVAILPGSREGEIRRILPVMLSAAEILRKRIPDVQFVLTLADTLDAGLIEEYTRSSSLPVRIVADDAYDAVGSSDAAMVCSGTATVETALLETPMIVVYRVSLLTYLVGRMVVSVDHIGMVNIIAGKTVAPEFIQNGAHPAKMADALYDLLKDRPKNEAVREELKKIAKKLGEPGAAERAARLACNLLQS
ncbi:MAG: lipid-A-disaccharide synthase [Syntrophales bacterium]|nr:lipid-A-disaccharide synthase [Syntrophales bacterium]